MLEAYLLVTAVVHEWQQGFAYLLIHAPRGQLIAFAVICAVVAIIRWTAALLDYSDSYPPLWVGAFAFSTSASSAAIIGRLDTVTVLVTFAVTLALIHWMSRTIANLIDPPESIFEPASSVQSAPVAAEMIPAWGTVNGQMTDPLVRESAGGGCDE